MDEEPQGLDPVTGIVDRWLSAVFDDADLAAAWPHTHPSLRLALVQSWLVMEADRKDIVGEERDVLAAALAAPVQPANALWDEFAGWRIVRWREVLPDYVTDRTMRGFVSGTHVVGPLLEAVLVARTGARIEAGLPVEVQRFLIKQSAQGSQVIGIGGVLPIPGWPPGETERLPT